MCERDGLERDVAHAVADIERSDGGKRRDVIRAYELLRYQQIKEKYKNYGSVTRQFGIEK